jgi:hypothetical protein
VTTTGAAQDVTGYSLALYGRPGQAIGKYGSLVVTLPPGEQAVALTDINDNCVVEGEHPRRVTMVAGQQVRVDFTVACQAPVASPWTLMPSGTDVLLESVSGTSSGNVFTASSVCGAVCSGAILHLGGASWTVQTETGGRDVWAAPGGEAFAITGVLEAAPVLRYDGTTWTPLTAPGIEFDKGNGHLGAIWGTSQSDVFAVGLIVDASDSKQPYIVHFDGTRWTRMATPPYEALNLTDVWGTSPTDVYAVGTARGHDDPTTNGVVYHYDGTGWSIVVNEEHLALGRVWGSSATDVYVTGSVLVPDGYYNEEGEGYGAIRHFDGVRWSAVPSPTSAPLGAVWAGAPNDVYLLEQPVLSGTIWHYDGTGWTQFDVGGGLLVDIWGSPSGDRFAVGMGGAILRKP